MNNQSSQGRGAGMLVRLESRNDDNGNQLFPWMYIINNTIANNNQRMGDGSLNDIGAGLWVEYADGTVFVFNNVIWGNKSGGEENINMQLPDGVDLAHNDIQFSSQYSWFDGSDDYDVDPVFVDSTNGNFKLSDGSPVIGAGDAEYSGQSVPNKDLLGNSRPAPSGSSPDLGAYENSLAVSPYPKQVKNVTATIGSQSVSLSWDANAESDLAKYLVYMSTTKGFTPAREDSVGDTTATVYNVTGLTNKTEYHFRVAAVNTSGDRGAFSQEVSATPEYKGPVWWVDVTNGEDNCDGSEQSPCDHLSNIFSIMANGDTIRMIPGDYGPGYQPQDAGLSELTCLLYTSPSPRDRG